jgi:hypothetical protein
MNTLINFLLPQDGDEFLHWLNVTIFSRRTLTLAAPSANKMKKKKEVCFYFAV